MYISNPPFWLHAAALLVVAAYAGLFLYLSRKVQREDEAGVQDIVREHEEAIAKIAFDEGQR